MQGRTRDPAALSEPCSLGLSRFWAILNFSEDPQRRHLGKFSDDQTFVSIEALALHLGGHHQGRDLKNLVVLSKSPQGHTDEQPGEKPAQVTHVVDVSPIPREKFKMMKKIMLLTMDLRSPAEMARLPNLIPASSAPAMPKIAPEAPTSRRPGL